ncbi:MAG TPA: hypothetical protein DF383_10170 [Deltaproteobacteria bacterium]|nr:hypothetical protein [Deltaproteobacteria bacterium]
MKGNKVELLLNTPILVEIPEEGADKKHLETIAKIQGSVLESQEGGITLELIALFNDRGHKLGPVRRWVFVPFHKIDHVFSLS